MRKCCFSSALRSRALIQTCAALCTGGCGCPVWGEGSFAFAHLTAATRSLPYPCARNLVKALPWYTSVREKINDPAYSGWFVHNKPGGSLPDGSFHVPQCDKAFTPPLCTDLYHDLDQTPGFPHGDGSCPGPCDCGGVPCGEYSASVGALSSYSELSGSALTSPSPITHARSLGPSQCLPPPMDNQ